MNRPAARLLTFQLPLAAFLVFLLFPFYWMLVTALKPNRDLYNLTVNPLWTWTPTLDHVRRLLWDTHFLPWMRNTLVISVGATALSLAASLLAAYAIGRLRFRGSGVLGITIFLTYLVPPVILFIPLSRIVSALGLWDRPVALVLTYPTFLVPFCVWLLLGYFRTLPRELEDCARVDGASRFQVMRYVTFPLALPGILSCLIFAFTLSWNEYLYALVFLSSTDQKTVPVGLATELVTGDVFQWGPLMAGALLGSVPVAVAYSFFVEHYVAALTGALKE
ncbi:MAG: carbohydrate ABC transporter permease [Armatimonadota bacterium]|nr:carbohydrate ABC transporter permease [Armatimonadota bacterium]MDR7414111.1 carbohydrate ABC transporter permease [Armatimonadota bacterium]MDR7430486.1 carbohydrate ABC transporter permease [Armatimonadota bacterium]MDR7432795.1 carbohydrate ABC transporter permease [Armatimonadota bacterium]MDR7445544.1 carbohydrate ABC transporter permease [Armatimonadota bacterium]